jgi:hypothetical protein
VWGRAEEVRMFGILLAVNVEHLIGSVIWRVGRSVAISLGGVRVYRS